MIKPTPPPEPFLADDNDEAVLETSWNDITNGIDPTATMVRMEAMTTRSELISSIYRTDLRSFVSFAFRELHNGQKLAPQWYIDLFCDRIEGVIRGSIRRLLLNAPPRTLKSFIATISNVAFTLGRDPTKRILLITGHQGLANELMLQLRKLMTSERYRSIFPQVHVDAAATTIRTPFGGFVKSAIEGQQLSGRGADLVIVDDPLSPTHGQDESTRAAVDNWFDAEVMQRLNDGRESSIVIVMQRVHDDDLSGVLLRRRRHPFDRIVLPSIATSSEEWQFADGRRYRREQGQVLNPSRESIEQQFSLFKQIGPYNYATQYLQNTISSKEEPVQFRIQPKGENSSLRCGFFRVPLATRIVHQVFGGTLPE